MSADNYKTSTVLEPNFEEYAQRALGLKSTATERMHKKFAEMSREMEDWTKKKFKKVPYVDRWSVTAKVLIVSAFFIPPIIFTIFYLVLWV